MATAIILPGVTPAQPLGYINFVPPVTSGLVGLYAFGADPSEPYQKNRASGGTDGTMTGTVVRDGYGIILDRLAYVQTAQAETTTWTYVGVVKKVAAGTTVTLLSTQGFLGPGYSQIGFRSSGARLEAKIYGSSEDASTIAYEPTETNPEFVAVTCSATVVKKHLPGLPYRSPPVTVGSGNPRSDTLSSARVLSGFNWRIGARGDANVSYGNPTTHYMTGIYNRELTNSEIGQLYLAARAWFAPRGVAI